MVDDTVQVQQNVDVPIPEHTVALCFQPACATLVIVDLLQVLTALRSRRLDGFKFKRQVAMGNYIADFMCFECKLIVELDCMPQVPLRVRLLASQRSCAVGMVAAVLSFHELKVIGDDGRFVALPVLLLRGLLSLCSERR